MSSRPFQTKKRTFYVVIQESPPGANHPNRHLYGNGGLFDNLTTAVVG